MLTLLGTYLFYAGWWLLLLPAVVGLLGLVAWAVAEIAGVHELTIRRHMDQVGGLTFLLAVAPLLLPFAVPWLVFQAWRRLCD